MISLENMNLIKILNVPILFTSGDPGYNTRGIDEFAKNCEFILPEFNPIVCGDSRGYPEVGLAKVRKTEAGLYADMVLIVDFLPNPNVYFPSFNGQLLARDNNLITAAQLNYVDLGQYRPQDRRIASLGNFMWERIDK